MTLTIYMILARKLCFSPYFVKDIKYTCLKKQVVLYLLARSFVFSVSFRCTVFYCFYFLVYFLSELYSLKCQKWLIFVFSAGDSKKSVTVWAKYLNAPFR